MRPTQQRYSAPRCEPTRNGNKSEAFSHKLRPPFGLTDDLLPNVLLACNVWHNLQTLRAIRLLCDAVDEAWSNDPSLEQLSLDVAVLEGAEADPTRHDYCGALYPINALRNLALLQVRTTSDNR